MALQNILKLFDKKEKILVIYLNPVHADLLIELGFKVNKTIKSGNYTEAIIYTHG